MLQNVMKNNGRPVCWKSAGAIVLFAAAAVAAQAQTFTTLVTFNDKNGGGYKPNMSLVQGYNGFLYGTTPQGGTGQNGTVFAMSLEGKLKTLVTFNGTDGEDAYYGLTLLKGIFYGATSDGGANGYGTLFSMTPQGALTTLYNFSGTEGAPNGALLSANGMLYGVTCCGGANGWGTIFSASSAGVVTPIYSFTDGNDGGGPWGGLVQGGDGLFYGTTATGGAYGLGTVFSVTASGTLTTLYAFSGPDGSNPLAALLLGPDGNFYGTTDYGGANNQGTVFQITPMGSLTTLYSFSGPDGATPCAPLILGTDGNFYGTTYQGGSGGDGTIFQLTSNGVLTSLFSFTYPDGVYPSGPLYQATDGNFYGATGQGGSVTLSRGTLFRLSMGLAPFVETTTSSGRVGAAVAILGTDLTGASSVTFNGTSATFTVVSATEIRATVPVGATSGTVQVVTPNSTLSSNAPFKVN